MVSGLQWPPVAGLDLQRPPGIGRVFYVRSTGVDEVGRGVDPGMPFQTITYALTQCVNWQNDYIVIMNNTSANEASWPIEIDINLVHIIGLWGAPYPNPTLIAVGAGNPVFQLNVDWIEIAGIELGAGDAATPIIQSPVGPGTIGHWWIHHCSFGWLNGMTMGSDGIWVQNTHDAPQCVIEHCMFNGPIAATNGLTRDGIRIEGNATRSIFRNNLFRKIDAVGIHCIQNGSDIGAILNNLFITPDSAVGNAIWMELGVGNALICGNRAGTDTAVPVNNPFRDSSAVGPNQLNAWIENYDSVTGAAHVNVAPAA